MTGKGLFSKLAGLAVVLLCAGALHLAISLMAEDIARIFVPIYSPIGKEEAKELAVKTCQSDSNYRYSWQPYKDCSMPSKEDITMQIQGHERDYKNYTLGPVKEIVLNVTNFVIGTMYAAVSVIGLWAIKTWFVANLWPKISGLLRPLHRTLNLSEMSATRRLRRVEAEFRTLKSLRDDGLITEEVFVSRKNKLKAAIKAPLQP
jgi:hypothetical protein